VTVDVSIFTDHESEVRTYCRTYPSVFTRAIGHRVFDTGGREYVDFLMAAGSLNYGHNPRPVKAALTRYLAADGIVNALDLHTVAKGEFIEDFAEQILAPRGLSYRLQFTGPTGANAVEAALKLARKVTGRRNVVAFSNGFHGMSLGALAVSTHVLGRRAAGTALRDVVTLPYDRNGSDGEPPALRVEQLIAAAGDGTPPAAFILETVQGEGGLDTASAAWLRDVQRVARDIGALVIVDDVQAGCGRTGGFFSFEGTGLSPDIVVLSKSLSGCGLPMSLVLIRPDLDCWLPGEHTGTFRGNNLAFVGASAAIRTYWADAGLESGVARRSEIVREVLDGLVGDLPAGAARVKGRGLMLGLEIAQGVSASEISRRAFRRGLIVETCGPGDEVLKLLPPLTIPEQALRDGLASLVAAVHEVATAAVGI
jgi:diaminobutyrate-2-oxoglutarate transaminase